MSARLRLAVSYAAFLVLVGIVVLAGVYVVLRYVPDYPLTGANPGNDGTAVASRQEILDTLLSMSAAIIAAFAVIGIVGGWFLAGWVLRPLRFVVDAARTAASGTLDHRVNLTHRNDEFRELADTFDHMLDRLQDAFAAQERFAANASHELRTPLSITAAMLDVAVADPDGQDYPRLLSRLRTVNARAIGITESLLRLADANAVTATSRLVDLDEIVRTALTEIGTEATRHRVTIHSDLRGARVSGDPMLLAQLVVNLVQNAVRHNVAGGTVYVTTTAFDRAVVLGIDNTGAAYSAEVAAQLHEPFLRGAGRTATVATTEQPRGHGLGLALVARIIDVHDGELAILPREGGGLSVAVRLNGAAP